MDHSIPAKLEIISLELAQKSDDNFLCSISLMKGMQNYGQIKFQIDKEFTEYAFTNQKFIKFSFTPRVASRKDVFFRIILTDLESNQQMGDIPISTHMLAEVFSDDKMVIQERKQFFQGVVLTYKIHQMLLEAGTVGQKQSGFHKQHEQNDFLSKIFSRPQFDEDHLHKSSVTKIRENSYQLQVQQQKKKQQYMPSFAFLKDPTKQQPQQSKQDSNAEIKININPAINPLDLLLPKQQNSMANTLKNSLQLHSSQLINRIFGLVRRGEFQEQKVRHTFSAKHIEHHTEHKMSKKIKLVIFLLIFGFLLTIFDVYQDKQQRRIIRKKKLLKSAQTKKKAL